MTDPEPCGGQVAWSEALTADRPAQLPNRVVTICDRCHTPTNHAWASDAVRAMAIPCQAEPPLTLPPDLVAWAMDLMYRPWLNVPMTLGPSYGQLYPVTVTPADQTEDS